MTNNKHLTKAEDTAKKVLDLCRINSSPIPIVEIVKKLGLNLIPYDLSDEVSGILIIRDNAGTIGYNPLNVKVRQRFTIAHELGHFLLHNDSKSEIFIDRDFIVKYRSQKKYTSSEIRQEQEANAFASAILMPKDLIKLELYKESYQVLEENEIIETLAKKFDVSLSAMTFRLSNLNLFQLA